MARCGAAAQIERKLRKISEFDGYGEDDKELVALLMEREDIHAAHCLLYSAMVRLK